MTDVPRCDKCRAYVNPFFKFKSNGHFMTCNLCKTDSKVPDYYYKGLDQNGWVNNYQNCPELVNGTVEFLVNENYSARPPKEPTYFFLIDISKSAFERHVPYYAIHSIKQALLNDRFNGGKNASFGIAFFDNNLHLLNLKGKSPSLKTVLNNCDSNYRVPVDNYLLYLEEYDS